MMNSGVGQRNGPNGDVDLSQTLKRGDSFARFNYADGAGYLLSSWESSTPNT